MRNMALLGLMFASAVSANDEPKYIDGDVYFTEASSSSYPVVLTPINKKSWYDDQQITFDFPGGYDSENRMCLTMVHNSAHPVTLSLYGRADNGYPFVSGLVFRLKSGERNCANANFMGFLSNLPYGYKWSAYVSGSISFQPSLRIDSLKARLFGKGYIPKEEAMPESSCSDGRVFVDAYKNAVSPQNQEGDYLTCTLDEGVTYEFEVESGGGAFHDQSQNTFGNVGITYNTDAGVRHIKEVNTFEPTYIKTDGSVSFFFADENSENKGGSYVKFKRTNID